MDITPKDSVETKALNIGQRISTAIGIIIAMGAALLAAVGDVKWIADNLPLLGTGVGALATGGLTAYVAVRRMRIDRIAGKAGLLLLLLLPFLMLTGCAVVFGKAGESSYTGFAFGEKTSSTLAGLNITETETKAEAGNTVLERGVGVDTAGVQGETDAGKILGNLVLLGLRSQGLPVAAAQTTSADVQPSALSPQSSDSAAVSYSTDGYGGVPAADGSGVYGCPSCARCRAYRAAHPDVELIDLDVPANRSAMWAALRRLTSPNPPPPSAALPVLITPSAYTMPAN